jgi:hypothetical protein
MSLLNNNYISIYRDIELEAFYDVDLKYRRKIIIAHMMIHIFPVIIVWLYYWQYSEFQYAKIALGVGMFFYFAVIGETTSYLFPKSRQFYKKNMAWFIIPFILASGVGGFYIGYELMAINFELDRDFLTGTKNIAAVVFFTFFAFFWAYAGLSQIFHASRALFKRKAAMEADMRFAAEVQERILRDIHVEQNGTRAYACSSPANELGGDYFELSVNDGRLFASVGDISGHSFGAGLLMTMTKSALQTHLEYTKDPARIASALNSMLLKQSDRSMYATMTMLSLDLSCKKALLCNAGHLPVFHISRGSSEIVHRYKKGIGLGITSMATYSGEEFSVEEGDLLILYSDGLIETRDENMKIRDAGFFEDLIRENIDAGYDSPADLTAQILNRVKECDHATEMEDDSSLIVIEV